MRALSQGQCKEASWWETRMQVQLVWGGTGQKCHFFCVNVGKRKSLKKGKWDRVAVKSLDSQARDAGGFINDSWRESLTSTQILCDIWVLSGTSTSWKLGHRQKNIWRLKRTCLPFFLNKKGKKEKRKRKGNINATLLCPDLIWN